MIEESLKDVCVFSTKGGLMESEERTTVGLSVVANQMMGHCPQCETGCTNAPHSASVWLFGKKGAWWSGWPSGASSHCARPARSVGRSCR